MINIRGLLAEEGIHIEGKAKPGTTQQLECPKHYCKKHRPADLVDTLKLEIPSEDFASWVCQHCNWSGHVGNEDPRAPAPAPEVAAPAAEEIIPADKPGELPPRILKYFTECGIDHDVLKRNKIRYIDDRNAIGFPYLDKDGNAFNMMVMDLPDRNTRLASAKRITLYGIDQVQTDEGYEIVLAQREMDRLILQTCGFKNVVALPNGGNIGRRQDEYGAESDPWEFFPAAADILLGARKIVIAVDNTPEGEKIRHEIARRVGAAKCFIVEYANQTLRDTHKLRGVDFTCDEINLARPHPIRGLYRVSDFQKQLEAYFQTGMTSGTSTGWENIDELFTVHPGQMTIITGIPNSGKSEWIDALMLNLAMTKGQRTAYFSPENTKEGHTTKLVEKKVQLSSNPKSENRMSLDTLLSGSAWVDQYFFFIVSDIMDEPATIDWILERAADAVMRFGIKNLVIDPWNRIHHTIGSQSETEYIREALLKILRFKVNHDVHVWLVIHPTKQEPDRKTRIIPPPSLYACAGSAHFVNMTDNGIVVHRKKGADNISEIHVNKVRDKHVGETGIGRLQYDKETGRYSPEPEASYSMAGDDPGGVQTTEAE